MGPHQSQHTRYPCPSPTPGVHPNSCALIESMMPSSHLILCHPLLLLPPIPPSIRVFSNESTLHTRWPKCCSFSFSISPSTEHPGLLSLRMDWLDLLVVQGTLKSLLQHHSSKASILRCSAFFTVQLSHPYMTTGKTIALTRRTFIGKTVSPLSQARPQSCFRIPRPPGSFWSPQKKENAPQRLYKSRFQASEVPNSLPAKSAGPCPLFPEM